MITVSPNQDDIYTALRGFLVGILPAGVEVVQGQINRVPEPQGQDFVVMWAINRPRLSTNVDGAQDILFTASIAATLLTVSAVNLGELQDGLTLFGANLAAGTEIGTQVSGTTGGIGIYNVTPSQNVSSQSMAAGFVDVLQPTEVIIQLDVHGSSSDDNVQIISTLFRDTYGVDAIQAINPDVTPLYTSDPRQIPFTNAEQQIETRWVVEAHLQVNQSIIVPQQFAGAAEVDVINVEATYP